MPRPNAMRIADGPCDAGHRRPARIVSIRSSSRSHIDVFDFRSTATVAAGERDLRLGALTRCARCTPDSISI
jgi:hypothetical protein